MADKINLNTQNSGSSNSEKDTGAGQKMTPAGIDIKPVEDKKAGISTANTESKGPAVKTLEIKASEAKPKEPKPPQPEKKSGLSSLFSFGKSKESAKSPLVKKDEKSIFEQEKTKEKETKMITSILKKSAPPKVKPILGTAPSLQKSIEEEKQLKQKKTLRLTQIIFLVVFLAATGMVFYFYSELSPTFDLFGANSTARLTDINKNLRSTQTSINKYRYLAAQLDLNTFSFVSDEFLDKTTQMTMNTLTPAQEASLVTVISQNANFMPQLLETIKENLTPDVVIETYRTESEEEIEPELIKQQFETDLRNSLLEDRNEITQNTTLSEANEQDLRLIDNTLKLVGNDKLINTIKAASIQNFAADLEGYAETLDITLRDDLQKFMGEILSSTKSDIATVGALKAQRIAWMWIIDKIEEVTAEVDPNFNSGLFEVTGLEVIYTGYELDSSSNKIVLSGVTKTTDAENFTLIADLIDAFEASPYFENVEMRSFTKSGSTEQGFTANFKIDLNIEVEGISPKNRPISLESRPVASAAAGVKRTK